MPFYDYVCRKCGYQFETSQSIKENPIKKCPSCKKNQLYRVINAPIHMTKGASKYDGMTPHHITLGNSGKKSKRNRR